MNIIYINGFTVVLEGMELDSYSVLQQCDLSDIEIPRFCYHDQLSIAGHCRICVVELSNSMKQVISCATEVSNYIEIYTNSLFVNLFSAFPSPFLHCMLRSGYRHYFNDIHFAS